MEGRIHSFQSLGTVDGPGVRAVVFMQGCPLRCVFCHNPDTWDASGGYTATADEMAEKILRLRSYFGKNGGVTVSGGEPLLQAEFVAELFHKCKKEGVHCALDTSGCVYNDKVEQLLELTDMVLLDYKFTTAEEYVSKCGCSIDGVERFLRRLESLGKRTWIRHVVIPGITDGKESLERIFELKKRFSCIEKIELLPFRKLCIEKYKSMGIDFPLYHIPEADPDAVAELSQIANK